MSWREVLNGGTLLEIEQGTSWSHEFPAVTAAGVPVDLTQPGYSARGQVRKRKTDSAVLYEWDSAAGNCALAADGVIKITVAPEESTSWTFRRAVWDLELTDPAGEVTRISSGHVMVSPEVTRS